MKRKIICVTAIAALLVAAFPAMAFEFIIGAGEGGQNNEHYVEIDGWTSSNAVSTAPGLQGTSRYSGTTVYNGPQRQAYAFWQPEVSGYYHINLAWPNVKGQQNTAVVLYTGDSIGGGADQWGNSSPTGVVYAGTMDMYERASDSWNYFTTAKLSSSTIYNVGIYGGYRSGVGANEDVPSRMVCIAGFQFVSATPDVVTYTGPANGSFGNVIDFVNMGLTWDAGENNTVYDVWVGEISGSLAKVASLLADTSFDLPAAMIQPGKTYYYRVDARNVDKIAYGAEYSFSTNNEVPETSALISAALGLVSVFGYVRRKK